MYRFQIEIKDKKYDAYLNDEDFIDVVKRLNPHQYTGYERAENGKVYYSDCCGVAGDDIDNRCSIDDKAYESANYYTDRQVAENNVRADTLMRNLRRFAAKNGGMLPLNTSKEAYFIYMYDEQLGIDRYISNGEKRFYSHFGDILFTTREAAEAAVDTFHDELVWYFTEYNPMP
jgi:hypothetical protein